ncbi:GAF domain-containing protein [Anaerosalibacter bizertensis]|uniref:GAF domain-containing protein n=1 Tax=Anaerosalibacter bizertensis TaxID=932217 RepID=A0A844FGJ6_9FIRM|nr:GAF domain-containing protein [Anaerosalibacter bizertensis]MBV1818309.1 GAF domain-containing protein [Bacteroidales bacterium MSK.15.36]MBU5292565.1 GAF domain-containing protein [Anaerosalibacter bizertensis]MCB5559912.1 GAF domain-containing protein [Anaerosalibacter bizertensis]MCG4564890.1 GAF domain-containing protein [Anaerosalibacter bizertensis]MCG4581661.1 GAF domain-containing protein [Anaerosalibacter bizertensis]
MFKLEPIKNMTEEERYRYMQILLKGQVSSESDEIANISNASAIIMACVDKLNWAGFYILKNGELVLGPFQGLPACNRIKVGTGVCGTSVLERKVLRVEDVHKFPGHIACDSASRSELVIPIIKNEKVYGVLDLDSPYEGRFTELEERYMIKFVETLNDYIDWEKLI